MPMSKYLFAILISLTAIASAQEAPQSPSREGQFSLQGYPVMWSSSYSSITAGNGIQLNYGLSEDDALTAAYLWTCAFIRQSHFCMKGFSLGLRHFVSKSIYFRAGLSQKWIDLHKDDYNLKAEANLIDLYFGSYWGGERFGFGIDWIGISRPLTTKLTSEQMDEPIDKNKREDQAESRELIQNGYQLNFMSIYLQLNF